MGKINGIKCSKCDYGISYKEGVGMAYSPNAVFYGRCDNPKQNWSIAFPDGLCEKNKPLLLELVDEDDIKDKAFKLLEKGATPMIECQTGIVYGHRLCICPECMRFSNKFYFKLAYPEGCYESDYRCPECNVSLRRVRTKGIMDRCRRLIIIEIVYFNHRKIAWTCPECGGSELISNGGMILWD